MLPYVLILKALGDCLCNFNGGTAAGPCVVGMGDTCGLTLHPSAQLLLILKSVAKVVPLPCLASTLFEDQFKGQRKHTACRHVIRSRPAELLCQAQHQPLRSPRVCLSKRGGHIKGGGSLSAHGPRSPWLHRTSPSDRRRHP